MPSVLVPVLLAFTLTTGAVSARSVAPPGPCLVPPIDAPVVDPFRMPACPYCAGNRGIEYGPRPGQGVVAMADGVVVFAGSVAGTRWLVVEHRDGLRASYGWLARMSLSRGDAVRAGQELGRSTDRFYVGLRDGDRPVDPTDRLGRWRSRPRLVPSDGTRGRPGGAARLVCRIAGGGR
jgi:murein DD-endopeptidase MepM/ murein hydrolase activator NlpD